MNRILGLLLLAGVIIGPGYYFYCAAVSGSSLEPVTVFSQDAGSIKAGNITVQSSGSNAEWNSPVLVELTPEMNPLTIDAIIRYLPSMGFRTKRTEYTADLSKDQTVLWKERFSVTANKEKKEEGSIKIGADMLPKVTTSVNTFTIEEPGEYSLHVEQTGDNDLAVARLQMRIRTNVIIPDKTIALSGTGILILAVAGLILTNRKKKP